MTTELTITEGLKRLKLLQKRMVRNCEDIERYSSLLSNEKPAFDTEGKQRAEVASLIQANIDLEKEYCKLKAMIDYTNLVTIVQIDDEIRTVHSWLTLLRATGKNLINTYRSLSTKEAHTRLVRFASNKENSPTITQLYDENEKRTGLRKWEDLTSGKIIEGRLEVINATTKLLDPPKV